MFIYFLWHIVVKSHGLRMILTDLQEKNNLKPENENLTESHRYIYIFKEKEIKKITKGKKTMLRFLNCR